MYLGAGRPSSEPVQRPRSWNFSVGRRGRRHGHGKIDQFFRFYLLIKSFNIIDAKKNVWKNIPKIKKSMKK
jgi:hypothetical protein